jgi:hypothetical protein
MKKKIYIKKTSGESELFDQEKLKKSLIRSNATTIVANDIIEIVNQRLEDGMSTSEIYSLAFNILKKKEKKSALRYSLRRSLLTLGPTGFPFEQFIAKIFEKKGWQTRTGVVLPGSCIDHEVDVIGYNDSDLILNEIKFHNDLSTKTDTKVALYVKARYDDLKDTVIKLDGVERKPTRGAIITNTKFTANARKYAKCVNLEMISWDYPEKGNLYDLMEETNLHPLTAITSLTKGQKKLLIEHGLINCSSVRENIDVLKKIGIQDPKIETILVEANEICPVK